jgi:hypothetical protein
MRQTSDHQDKTRWTNRELQQQTGSSELLSRANVGNQAQRAEDVPSRGPLVDRGCSGAVVFRSDGDG